jgi:hypothetical protein
VPARAFLEVPRDEQAGDCSGAVPVELPAVWLLIAFWFGALIWAVWHIFIRI